ncbi:MAG TPA: hypothetical protein DDW24_15735, partial [Blastocatellia bacterium]|nr:hypothetical protein [Blastocatellia bacterium]
KMNDDEKSGAIVKTILMLGENLGIDVVAEGIETERQLESLRTLGCKLGQGYLFSRPVDASKARKLLKKRPLHIKQLHSHLDISTPVLEVTNIQ